MQNPLLSQSAISDQDDSYSRDNPKLMNLIKQFLLTDIGILIFSCVGIGFLSIQLFQVPDSCTDVNMLFLIYLGSFIVTLLLTLLNLFTVRNAKNDILKYSAILLCLAALASKGAFVVVAILKRNRSMGMCFFYHGQNNFFIAQGLVEGTCILFTQLLVNNLSKQVKANRLSGRIPLWDAIKRNHH